MNYSAELYPIYNSESTDKVWGMVNPAIPLRTLAYSTDNGKFKIGDGRKWRDLGYLVTDSVTGNLQTQIDSINGNVETLQSTTQTQGSQITNLQDKIALAVTTDTFTTYQTAVSGQFSGINTRLSSDESSITTLQDQIALTVTQSYVDEQFDARAKIPIILTNSALSFACGTGAEASSPIAFYDGSPIQINIAGPNTVTQTVNSFQTQSLTVAQFQAKYNSPAQFQTGAVSNPVYTCTDGTRTSTLSITAIVGQGDYLTYNGSQAYLNGVAVPTAGQLLAYTGGTITVSGTGIPFTEKLSYAMDAYGTAISTNMSYAQSSIKVLSDDIDLKVDKNGVIGEINLSPETAKIQAKYLDLTGLVTVTSLETAGQTVINGANLTTGKIQSKNGNVFFDLDEELIQMETGLQKVSMGTTDGFGIYSNSNGSWVKVGGLDASGSNIATKIMSPDYPGGYGVIGKGPSQNDGVGLFLFDNFTNFFSLYDSGGPYLDSHGQSMTWNGKEFYFITSGVQASFQSGQVQLSTTNAGSIKCSVIIDQSNITFIKNNAVVAQW